MVSRLQITTQHPASPNFILDGFLISPRYSRPNKLNLKKQAQALIGSNLKKSSMK